MIPLRLQTTRYQHHLYSFYFQTLFRASLTTDQENTAFNHQNIARSQFNRVGTMRAVANPPLNARTVDFAALIVGHCDLVF